MHCVPRSTMGLCAHTLLACMAITSTTVMATRVGRYLGVIKQVRDDPDQVPRCWWWPQNNHLRGTALPLTQHGPSGTATRTISSFAHQRGVIVEAVGGTGVLVQSTAPGGHSRPIWTALLFTKDLCFSRSEVATLEPLNLTAPRIICRGMPRRPTAGEAGLHFRVLLRNHKSRAAEGATADADALLSEFYVNDVLGDVYTLSGQHATGAIGSVGGGQLAAYAASFGAASIPLKTDDFGEVLTGTPIQCTSVLDKPQWPTFHALNAVTRDSGGVLHTAHLNDANAIFEFGGLYHIMCQKGGSDWTHSVSSDLLHWWTLPDALDGEHVGPNSTWNHETCDG
eukprot:SAG31_NODE_6338_length_2057_cov_24.509704_2_plen_338_part_01